MTQARCTCGPAWVYEPGCGFPHRDDSMCAWCEDAEERDRLEAHAEGECPELDELEDAGP